MSAGTFRTKVGAWRMLARSATTMAPAVHRKRVPLHLGGEQTERTAARGEVADAKGACVDQQRSASAAVADVGEGTPTPDDSGPPTRMKTENHEETR
jgi:hypothetical protein